LNEDRKGWDRTRRRKEKRLFGESTMREGVCAGTCSSAQRWKGSRENGGQSDSSVERDFQLEERTSWGGSEQREKPRTGGKVQWVLAITRYEKVGKIGGSVKGPGDELYLRT